MGDDDGQASEHVVSKQAVPQSLVEKEKCKWTATKSLNNYAGNNNKTDWNNNKSNEHIAHMSLQQHLHMYVCCFFYIWMGACAHIKYLKEKMRKKSSTAQASYREMVAISKPVSSAINRHQEKTKLLWWQQKVMNFNFCATCNTNQWSAAALKEKRGFRRFSECQQEKANSNNKQQHENNKQ